MRPMLGARHRYGKISYKKDDTFPSRAQIKVSLQQDTTLVIEMFLSHNTMRGGISKPQAPVLPASTLR